MVLVAARPLADVEDEIKQRLKAKANQPQVMLRVTKNVTSNATVVGEVKQSLRLPLTAKGEKVMDALAASGGVTQAVGKITLQLSRRGESKQLPMQRLIEDPAQNISLEPGDVVTALYQPLSFTVLGATGKNEEINFEAQGISLAQGLARAGGLQDQRADAQGVFIFRFEEPTLVESTDGKPLKVTSEGKVPVVYRVDMKDPRAFLAAQSFPLRNKDLLYVSNAPAAELQKFLNILTSSIFSISNFTKHEIENHLSVQNKSIQVIYNGVESLLNKPSEKPSWLAETNDFLFCVGNITAKKNFDVLLPMMKLLPNQYLIIAGNGESEYAHQMRKKIDEEKISNVLMTGKISEVEKNYLMQNCKAFLFPSLLEGFGLPMIEAMSCGKPVFVSNLTSLPEIAADKGFYFENFDAQAMATFVEQKLATISKSFSNELIIHASKFQWHANAEKYIEVYRKL